MPSVTCAARVGYNLAGPYTGEMVGEIYTPMAQPDFAADIAKIRASGADAVFAFYPGSPSCCAPYQGDPATLGSQKIWEYL